MRLAHGAAHGAKHLLAGAKPRRAAPAGTQRNRPPTLTERLFFELEFQLPARRQFMAPFTDLSFAAQISTALLVEDYPGF